MAGKVRRVQKPPVKIQNAEKLKDPKYALALHLARSRRERRGGPQAR
jgi:hypothetical protein